MAYASGCFADTDLSESNFYWITTDAQISDMPEDIHDGTLAVCTSTKKKWIKVAGTWEPYGG